MTKKNLILAVLALILGAVLVGAKLTTDDVWTGPAGQWTRYAPR